jgi:hypothetical protein
MMKQPLPVPSSQRERDVLEWIARVGVVDSERLVHRFFLRDGEDVADAAPRAEAALKRLVSKGYLQVRQFHVDGARPGTSSVSRHRAEHHLIRTYGLTPRASSSLHLPLLPPLREKFLQHHLKLLTALTMVETQQAAKGGRLMDFKLEGQLIQEDFQGKRFTAKTRHVMPCFPDARLTLRHANGSSECVFLEYVSSKYTDQDIRGKADAWRGQSTLWAVPNPSTAARVQQLTGEPALLV